MGLGLYGKTETIRGHCPMFCYTEFIILEYRKTVKRRKKAEKSRKKIIIQKFK